MARGAYDDKGRVVGYFLEVIDQQTTITTNENVTTVNGQTLSTTNHMARLPLG